jgi:hypothetical protein
MDVTAWLRGLGLERYEAAFQDNEIDGDALPKLTAEDLKDLGVVLVSHRRRLLEAIAALSSPLPNPPPPAGEGRVGAERRQLTLIRLIEEVNPDWRDYYPALLNSGVRPRHPPWVTIVAPGRKSATMAINAQRRHWTDPFAGRNINGGARRRAVLIIRMHLRTSRH